MYKDQINVSYVMNLYKDVEDGLILISKGIIDQIIKIYMHMQLEYVRSKNKPQIDMEFVSNVVKKSFPGTLIHLKNLYVPDSVDGKEESLTIIEQNAFTKIKEYLSISGLIYNEKNNGKIIVITKTIHNIEANTCFLFLFFVVFIVFLDILYTSYI